MRRFFRTLDAPSPPCRKRVATDADAQVSDPWTTLLPELRGEVRQRLDPFTRRLLRLVSRRDAADDAAWDPSCPLGPYSALVEGHYWHVATALWPAAMDGLRASVWRATRVALVPETARAMSHSELLATVVASGQRALMRDLGRRRH